MFAQTSHTLPTSLLYTTLLHRQCYAPATFTATHHWSHVDLAVTLEQLRTIMTLWQRHRRVREICEQIYGGHCVDVQDRRAVVALTEALMLTPKQLKQVCWDTHAHT